MSRVRDTLAQFKAFTAAIEFTEDTLVLDRMLAEASQLLYDTRHAIDSEWAAQRRDIKGTAKRLTDLDITTADIEAFLGEQKP